LIFIYEDWSGSKADAYPTAPVIAGKPLRNSANAMKYGPA
jgi:hypothetical protein